jgi:raffinose/stachyose/melibiose transport system permease protein
MIAVKTPAEFKKNMYSFPKKFAIDNFITAISDSNYFTLFKNSTIITIVSVLLLVIVATMAAYPISRIKSKFYNSLNLFFLAGLMVPIQMIMLPLYKIMIAFKLINTHWGLILINIGGAIPFSVFLIGGFLKTIPGEIEEAAFIDGASKIQTFRLIILPLARPGILTLTVLQSIFFWNDFLLPLIFLKSIEKQTIMVGIYNFVGEYVTEWNYIFALVTISILPILILYLVFQRHIVEGIVAGSIKE